MTGVISTKISKDMTESVDDLLRRTTIFRRLTADDRQRLAAMAMTRSYDKGAVLFAEGEPSELLLHAYDGRHK